jgi:hypothetical protein
MGFWRFPRTGGALEGYEYSGVMLDIRQLSSFPPEKLDKGELWCCSYLKIFPGGEYVMNITIPVVGADMTLPPLPVFKNDVTPMDV